MDQHSLQKNLSPLKLSEWRYFESTGSTNDEALVWAAQGAPDLSLILADEQTTGRGRAGRKWATPRGTALALSLILRPTSQEAVSPALFTGLGALALVDALKQVGLSAQIKWPNDILLNRKKCSGILVESVWTGEALDAVVIGVGVNVLAASVPPAGELRFPATSLEAELGRPLERVELLTMILSALLQWRSLLGSEQFIHAWDSNLAFKEETVHI